MVEQLTENATGLVIKVCKAYCLKRWPLIRLLLLHLFDVRLKHLEKDLAT